MTDQVKIEEWANIACNALVRNDRDVFTIPREGTDTATLTAYRTKDGRLDIIHGFGFNSLDEFTVFVNHEYGDSEVRRECRKLIEFLKVRFDVDAT